MADQDRKTQIDRRTFLVRGGQATAAVALVSSLPAFVRAEGASTSTLPYPFTLGIASGEPLSTAVVIWTRLAPAPQEPRGGMPERPELVYWQVARDEHFRVIERWGVSYAKPERGHTVHVDVRGLEPARTYFYRFWAAGHMSPVGRTRTAPGWGALPSEVRFAFASCQHFEQGFYTAYKHMAEEDLHFVAFLGDYIYEGVPTSGRPRRHDDGEPDTLEAYRRRYATYKSDPHLQAAHARFAWIVTPDDHEVDNDYSDEIPQDPQLQPRDAFLARRAAAYQAYWEHMPLRAFSEPSGPDIQLYRRLGYGQLLDLHVLDTRQYRSVTKPCGAAQAPICEALLDPTRTILGDAQERWLLDGLGRSRARWNVLAQQVPFAFTDMGQGEQVEVRQDKWDAYPVARQRIVDFIAERKPQNPIVLTGDLHNAWVTLLKRDHRDPDSQTLGAEFIGTSITSGGDGTEQTATAPTVIAKNPQVLFNSNLRGYVSCSVSPRSWTSHYRVVPYVTTEGAPLETRASFVVEDGDPEAYKA